MQGYGAFLFLFAALILFYVVVVCCCFWSFLLKKVAAYNLFLFLLPCTESALACETLRPAVPCIRFVLFSFYKFARFFVFCFFGAKPTAPFDISFLRGLRETQREAREGVARSSHVYFCRRRRPSARGGRTLGAALRTNSSRDFCLLVVVLISCFCWYTITMMVNSSSYCLYRISR